MTMTISIGMFFILVAFFYAVGAPVAISMALSSLLYLISNGIAPVATIQKIFSGIDNTTYLCIPFFLLTGTIMVKGGIADRLMYVSRLIVGNFRGGLCYVTILTGVFFAAITGTTLACVAAIGPMMIPAMVKDKYSREFSTAVTCAGSTLGPVIPPSLGLIVYASLTSSSVKQLYMVGVPTGILIALSLCLLVFIRSKKRGYAPAPLPRWRDLTPEEKRYRMKMLRDSLWAFGAPVIILGGIFGGIFTPTEASVVSALYSLLVSMFVFKQVKFKDLPKIFASSGAGAAKMMFIVACATLFAWVLNYEKVPQTVLSNLTAISTSPTLFLALLFVVYLALGMLVDANSILLITIPLFLPLMISYKLNLVHLGLVLQGLLCLGTLTPPFGTMLFAGSYIGEVSVQSLIKEIMPFVGVMLLMIILIAAFPQLIMWIV